MWSVVNWTSDSDIDIMHISVAWACTREQKLCLLSSSTSQSVCVYISVCVCVCVWECLWKRKSSLPRILLPICSDHSPSTLQIHAGRSVTRANCSYPLIIIGSYFLVSVLWLGWFKVNHGILVNEIALTTNKQLQSFILYDFYFAVYDCSLFSLLLLIFVFATAIASTWVI